MTEIINPKKAAFQHKVMTADNSSMAQDFSEIKKLGKEMKAAKTGSELKEENLTSDPIQQKGTTGEEKVEEIIKTVADSFEDLCCTLTDGIITAGNIGNQALVDMLYAIRTSLEAHGEMLKACQASKDE